MVTVLITPRIQDVGALPPSAPYSHQLRPYLLEIRSISSFSWRCFFSAVMSAHSSLRCTSSTVLRRSSALRATIWPHQQRYSHPLSGRPAHVSLHTHTCQHLFHVLKPCRPFPSEDAGRTLSRPPARCPLCAARRVGPTQLPSAPSAGTRNAATAAAQMSPCAQAHTVVSGTGTPSTLSNIVSRVSSAQSPQYSAAGPHSAATATT